MLRLCLCWSSWILGSIFCKLSKILEYPTNIPVFPEGSNFVLFSFGMCMYTRHPYILRWMISGFLLENTSSGVLFSSTLCGVQFCTYTAVMAAFSHRCMGRYWSWSIDIVASMIFLFLLSATPFCCGLYGVDNSLLFPESLHNSLNSFDVNYSPLSDRKVLILFSVWFSINSFTYLNLLNTSSLFFRKYIHVFLEKS